MAWIIGLVTDEELRKLRALGWKDEDPPAELVDESLDDANERTRAFFVDSDVYAVMTGPDWEQPDAESGVASAQSETTLADHAEAWALSTGQAIPARGSAKWDRLYAAWIEYAFSNAR